MSLVVPYILWATWISVLNLMAIDAETQLQYECRATHIHQCCRCFSVTQAKHIHCVSRPSLPRHSDLQDELILRQAKALKHVLIKR